MATDLTGASTELLQALIRAECVNDGTPDSGGEARNVDLLHAYLEGPGVEMSTYESRLGVRRWWLGWRAATRRRPPCA